jgi:hypothetical protein
MSDSRITRFKSAISGSRERLVQHAVYAEIASLDDLRVFMEHHVFAVWDFMSLLKHLQKNLTCVDVPWLPVGNPTTRFLINEIVTGEESDTDPQGNIKSHFELYLEAMKQVGADTGPVERFVQALVSGKSVEHALLECQAPAGAVSFVTNTFRTIRSGKTHAVAAVFTFGREDLIPDMFMQLLKRLQREFPGKVDLMHYYVQRHIEVDGGHHGELALRMTEELCGADEIKWSESESEVISALDARWELWTSISKSIAATALKA